MTGDIKPRSIVNALFSEGHSDRDLPDSGRVVACLVDLYFIGSGLKPMVRLFVPFSFGFFGRAWL